MNPPRSTYTKSCSLCKSLLILLIIAAIGVASLYGLFYLIFVKPIYQIGHKLQDYVQKVEIHARGGDINIGLPKIQIKNNLVSDR